MVYSRTLMDIITMMTKHGDEGENGLQKTQLIYTRQWDPPSGRYGISNIPHTEKRCQKCHSDTMVDKHKPLPGVHMGGNNHQTGLVPRKNT